MTGQGFPHARVGPPSTPRASSLSWESSDVSPHQDGRGFPPWVSQNSACWGFPLCPGRARGFPALWAQLRALPQAALPVPAAAQAGALSVSWRTKPSRQGDTGTRARSWVGFSWLGLKPSCFDWDTPQNGHSVCPMMSLALAKGQFGKTPSDDTDPTWADQKGKRKKPEHETQLETLLKPLLALSPRSDCCACAAGASPERSWCVPALLGCRIWDQGRTVLGTAVTSLPKHTLLEGSGCGL